MGDKFKKGMQMTSCSISTLYPELNTLNFIGQILFKQIVIDGNLIYILEKICFM